jgi:hypothetical protein
VLAKNAEGIKDSMPKFEARNPQLKIQNFRISKFGISKLGNKLCGFGALAGGLLLGWRTDF